jgi:hypothetical protein
MQRREAIPNTMAEIALLLAMTIFSASRKRVTGAAEGVLRRICMLCEERRLRVDFVI